ncbi:MAG: hypothetical protein ACLPVW_06035 [Terriglobales bacterium]
MASYPIEIRRCGHIKTNGTQCGSPALKGKERCYYHEHNRPEPAELYMDGDRYCDSQIVLPVFEDAHSIQTVIRQVVQLMLTRRIERKDAGLMLYALQIASGNLKMMQAEKASPTQVVVEPEKAAETPLGMTPWSASGEGHDCDEAVGGESEAEDSTTPTPEEFYAALGGELYSASLSEELYSALSLDEREPIREKLNKKGLLDPAEYGHYCVGNATDPVLLAIRRLGAGRDGGRESQDASLGSAGEREMPPGSIQACREKARMASAVG